MGKQEHCHLQPRSLQSLMSPRHWPYLHSVSMPQRRVPLHHGMSPCICYCAPHAPVLVKYRCAIGLALGMDLGNTCLSFSILLGTCCHMGADSEEEATKSLHKIGMFIQKEIFLNVLKNILNHVRTWQTVKNIHCSLSFVHV